MNVYQFSVEKQDGNQLSLDIFKGKVLLIVNTATGCGFTPQYKGLQDLYLRYRDEGFEILESGETFQPIKFFDTGALVWFAKIIEWEFPNFSVESHLDNLYKVQEIIESNGAVEGRIHRFYIVGKKI